MVRNTHTEGKLKVESVRKQDRVAGHQEEVQGRGFRGREKNGMWNTKIVGRVDGAREHDESGCASPEQWRDTP